jgi:hypothetical protein
MSVAGTICVICRGVVCENQRCARCMGAMVPQDVLPPWGFRDDTSRVLYQDAVQDVSVVHQVVVGLFTGILATVCIAASVEWLRTLAVWLFALSSMFSLLWLLTAVSMRRSGPLSPRLLTAISRMLAATLVLGIFWRLCREQGGHPLVAVVLLGSGIGVFASAAFRWWQQRFSAQNAFQNGAEAEENAVFAKYQTSALAGIAPGRHRVRGVVSVIEYEGVGREGERGAVIERRWRDGSELVRTSHGGIFVITDASGSSIRIEAQHPRICAGIWEGTLSVTTGDVLEIVANVESVARTNTTNAPAMRTNAHEVELRSSTSEPMYLRKVGRAPFAIPSKVRVISPMIDEGEEAVDRAARAAQQKNHHRST